MTATARILIVDDDPTAIEVLEHALEGMGDLCFATGGTDALALMATHPADLILLDANMPDMDGYATCQILKQEYPGLPVIFVTAFSEEGCELRALKAGAVDFIHKPIKPPVVRARVGVHLQLAALNAELHVLSDRDALTGIANRRSFDERLTLEWRRAARQRQPLGLLMIDIDHFKRYNDYYGHLQGDDCLRRVAQALAMTATRAGDLVSRYGGEEFAVLLPGSSLESAAALGAKVCAAIRALGIPHADSDAAPQVTVSIGAASGVPSRRPSGPGSQTTEPSAADGSSGLPSVEALLARADRALYAAKAAGRDRVCMDEPGTETKPAALG
jgi:diguanylate cyclase (GGDEF)-like protein